MDRERVEHVLSQKKVSDADTLLGVRVKWKVIFFFCEALLKGRKNYKGIPHREFAVFCVAFFSFSKRSTYVHFVRGIPTRLFFHWQLFLFRSIKIGLKCEVYLVPMNGSNGC